MADNRWVQTFASGAPAPSALRDELLKNAPLVIPTASEVATTALANCRALLVAGALFYYDSADTTSAHDGVSVLVSSDGRRYKLGKPQFVPYRVESYADDPPGSPSLGEAYLIGEAPSGAWAAHADEIAIYTVNGWVFINPDNVAGLVLYVADEDSSYQFTDAGWRKGLGASAVGDGSIRPNHLAGTIARVFSVENQTTNTPPGSPAEGNCYIIGPSPTGAWSGAAGRIAVYQDSAWVIFTPVEGWRAWDKSSDIDYVFNGSSWVSPLASAIAIPRIVSSFVSNAGTATVVGAGNGGSAPQQYSYSSTVAPTTAARRLPYTFLDLTFAATASGKKLVFQWDGVDLSTFNQSGFTCTLAIFRDSETSAILWCDPNKFRSRMMMLSADASSHVYRLAVTCSETLGTVMATLREMSFSVMEVAA